MMGMAIITPTSPATLLEDMQEIAFAKARRALSGLRQSAAACGTDQMTMEIIDAEIQSYRKQTPPSLKPKRCPRSDSR